MQQMQQMQQMQRMHRMHQLQVFALDYADSESWAQCLHLLHLVPCVLLLLLLRLLIYILSLTLLGCRYKLNIWDVGGQKTLRPYWRNYYEKTDGLIWVIDSADLARLHDCKAELHNLLKEERLFGATLLILANKQDIPSALTLQQILEVRSHAGKPLVKQRTKRGHDVEWSANVSGT